MKVNQRFLSIAMHLGVTFEELLVMRADEVLRRMRAKVMS